MPRVTRRQAAADPDASPPATTTKSGSKTGPTGKPLYGFTIAFSGTFPSQTHAGLQKQLAAAGAKVAKTVPGATHLITTAEDFAKPGTKVVAAQSNNVTIVSLEWALESIDKDSPLNEDSYAFTATKKRPIAIAVASDDDAADATTTTQPDADASKSKKRKTATNGKASKNASKVKDESPEPAKEPEQKKAPLAEGGIANSKDLVVPLDPVLVTTNEIGSGFNVYIDASGVIYDVSLAQSNSGNNNNKFYIIQVVENKTKKKYHCWTRWGRVGETGQKALLGAGTLPDALKHFEKKFKDKSGLRWDDRTEAPKPGKYAYIERSYDPDSDDEDAADDKGDVEKEEDVDAGPVITPKCTLDAPVRELVELIFNQKFFNNTMASFNYDANKLPLGKLGKMTITRGFQALKDLGAILIDPSAASAHNMSAAAAIEHFSNLYFTVIPHSFGRNRPPIINSPAQLKKEVEMLESLSDMKYAADLMKATDTSVDPVHPLDRHFQGLNLEEMTALDPATKEFKLLAGYLQGSKGSTHHLKYEVIDIFRISRAVEKSRFAESSFSKIKSDRRLLWHGSRVTNFGGILSQGLRIAPPEAPVSGYMFGKGIYLADMSSKSAGYTCASSSDGNALLLLCEAELGDPMQELVNASYNAGDTAKKGGMASTWGKGRTGPAKWVDGSTVHPSLKGIKLPDPKSPPGDTNVDGAYLQYNEYICYDVSQVQLRYLFRVKLTYTY
ncbi:related to NAD+ ADP-ribosyltransferase [Cephalotrichum gorgonifer]|uniref:Poly [ADP-ribose] polymerase n=1 Tax=Cephalotrichum gorgonifer TaxID=2041049 RepID=A0AAE8N3V7_9PEZI|nr:related to NAD+ ADP-ribosyltransferase [Cephalotrichum gorgonifer]